MFISSIYVEGSYTGFPKCQPVGVSGNPFTLSLSRNPVSLEKLAFTKLFQFPCSFLLSFAKGAVNAMHLSRCSGYKAGEEEGRRGCDGVCLPKSPCGGALVSWG